MDAATFTSCSNGALKWNSLHPLRFHLAYEQLRCPYDLPAEKKRHCRPHHSSWFSSLLDVQPKSQQGVIKKTPSTGGDIRCTEKLTKLPTITSPRPLMDYKEGDVAHLPSVDANTAGPACMDRAEEKGTDTAPTCHGVGDRNPGASNCSSSESCMADVDADMHTYPAAQEGKAALSTVCDPSNEGRRYDTLESTERKCDIAVGPDLVGENGDGYNTYKGPTSDHTSVKCRTLPQLEKLEEVFSETVERMYKKVQESAQKVVVLDNLSQQLLNTVHTPEKGRVAVEDKTELGIYLHSLSRQVQMLKKMWDASETSRLASERRQARQSASAPKVVRVEIVRAYEQSPVPYKKAPFVPLSTAQRLAGDVGARSYQSSTSQSITSGSTFTVTQTVTSSRNSTLSNRSTGLFSLETVYTDDFEDG